ncbi:MAG: hypothetical protein KAI66_01890 [Lentisphaeria bacterium]|nr:hypothetical protein [Lentisphaeria bacterium]
MLTRFSTGVCASRGTVPCMCAWLLLSALLALAPVRAEGEKRSLDDLLRGGGKDTKKEQMGTKEQDPAKGKNDAADMVDIQAETAEWDLDGRTGDLVGNVIVTYGDRTLTADRMKVFMNEKNELERVEAHGNVVMREKKGKNRATGGKAVYDIIKDIIVLSDSPVLYRGEEWKMTNAKTVTYNLRKREFKAEEGRISIRIPKRKNGGTGDGRLPFDLGNRKREDGKDKESGDEDTRKNDRK